MEFKILTELLVIALKECDIRVAEHVADYLLSRGIIVPPFKVGTRVYVVVSRTSNNKNLYIVEDVITHYRIFDDCMIMCFVEHLGLPDYKWGNVFLTKEEAEQALNNIQNGNGCEGGTE